MLMVLRLPNNIVIVSKTYPSFLTVKEGSTFLTKPLFPQGREDVTALRCSEPLRYKVGGPSKVSPGNMLHLRIENRRPKGKPNLRDYFFFLFFATFWVMILPGCSVSHTAAPPCLK